ncbi:MAG: hypothetical protein HYZ26_13605 [Chloroflexi bacterium]|nr:hypothetical protein [Chloroflexota bacterium]
MNFRVRSNVDLVLIALSKLGGAKNKISTEDVAVEAFYIAPDRFSWVSQKYKKYPDKEVTRMALEDAAKDKHGKLVIGRYARDTSKDGWKLSPNGVRWLEENRLLIESSLQGVSELPKMSPKEVKRLKSQFEKDPAYRTFLKEGLINNISRFMFTDMLQCSPDASPQLINEKFQRLLALVELADLKAIAEFLGECKLHFKDLFETS